MHTLSVLSGFSWHGGVLTCWWGRGAAQGGNGWFYTGAADRQKPFVSFKCNYAFPPGPCLSPAGGARVDTTGVSSSRFALITGVSGKRLGSCLVSACLLLFLLDIILPAEQKGREEGNFNSTPEWRVSHNQCIQACNTACHRDSITRQQGGGGRMGY